MNHERNETEIMGIDLRVLITDVLRGAKRLLWLGVLLAALGAGAFALRVWRNYSPLYRATASFTVYVTNPLYSGSRTYNASTAEQMAKTFPYILTSGALSDAVRSELGLTALPSISASVLENTNIFTLSVTSGDPQLAYDVLNATIRCYPSVAEFVVGPTVMNLLDESGVPAYPINSRDYIGAVKKGVVTGAALWAVIVLFYALTRSTIHNEKELERIVNLKCIGMLPTARGLRKGRGSRAYPVLEQENDRFGFSESVRLLRIRIEKELHRQGKKVLLVSSAVSGEGKSTVAANLAAAMARKGRRTLLIDCDLRNPSAAAIFGVENTAGLSEYLNRRITAEKIIRPMNIDNLFVVFGGAPVSNASELLARKELQAFIDTARQVFDCIILDTPPCSLLADAAELTGLADCAVMVIRQNTASRTRILDGAQLLADGGLSLIGCVLNGVERSDMKHGYGYYGYGYGKYGTYGER